MSSNKPIKKKVNEVFRFGCVGHRSSLAGFLRGRVSERALQYEE